MKLNFVPPDHDHGWYFKDGQGRVVMAQGQPVPLHVANEIAGWPTMISGWNPWAGGDDMPLEAVGQRIDIELRNGEIWQNQQSETVGKWLSWAHQQLDGDIIYWRVSPMPDSPWDDDEMADANGWHDIDVQPTAPVWPDEVRADRDPTAIMGGVVLPPVEGPLPPTLTVAVDAGGCAPPVLVDRPANVGTRLCNGILLGIGAISATLALVSIGAGFPPAAVLFTANAMYAVHSATT